MSDVETLFKRNPLLKFSLYTAGQAQTLERVGKRLAQICSGWTEGNPIDNIQEYYDLFWLWTLGAYEVVRTMDQHSNRCFTAAKCDQIKELKANLAILRIPFAKQEVKGRKGPIFSENSALGVDQGLIFEVEQKRINSRELVDSVLDFFADFSIDDIVQEIPPATKQKT